jgi:hypothetical protein
MANETATQPSENAEHNPVRPLKFVRDENGNGWLCDKNVDVDRDLKKQGCWRCEEMAFPDGGR